MGGSALSESQAANIHHVSVNEFRVVILEYAAYLSIINF
jgi:hypothetical protein